MTVEQSLEMARRIETLITSLPDFSEETANQPLRDLATELELKAGHVFGFLRSALTAQEVSPPVFETMEIIGREKVLKRVRNAIEILEKMKSQTTAPTFAGAVILLSRVFRNPRN